VYICSKNYQSTAQFCKVIVKKERVQLLWLTVCKGQVTLKTATPMS